MLTHPQFDPILFSLGPLAVRWYGLMYVVAFIAFVVLAKVRVRRGFGGTMAVGDVDDLLLYGVLGVILGGRLGYVLFYKPEYYLAHPAEIIQIWTGGMSFHGGFLGVLVAVALFCWRRKKRWIEVMDLDRAGGAARASPPGASATSSTASCRGGPPTCRGACGSRRSIASRSRATPRSSTSSRSRAWLLFALLWWFASKPRPAGAVSGAFLIGYGVFRFIAEFGRQPDDFLGLLAFNLSMGQWLSLPMILVGDRDDGVGVQEESGMDKSESFTPRMTDSDPFIHRGSGTFRTIGFGTVSGSSILPLRLKRATPVAASR